MLSKMLIEILCNIFYVTEIFYAFYIFKFVNFFVNEYYTFVEVKQEPNICMCLKID